MPALATILAAIQAGVTAIPEGLTLINELKKSFSDDEQAEIDALVKLDKAADDRHEQAQNS